jgi:ABC-type multidrug transport system permease subunit
VLDKRVTLGDCLPAIAIVLPAGAGLGALMGFSSNRFSLSGGIRTGIIVGFAMLCGSFARRFVMRRVRERAGRARD